MIRRVTVRPGHSALAKVIAVGAARNWGGFVRQECLTGAVFDLGDTVDYG
jgi:hypothetical protein